jgi:hypothetical protein
VRRFLLFGLLLALLLGGLWHANTRLVGPPPQEPPAGRVLDELLLP